MIQIALKGSQKSLWSLKCIWSVNSSQISSIPRPWFREMLMDQDDLAFISALRAVAAHYRRCAQQQALGVGISWLGLKPHHTKSSQKPSNGPGDSITPVPICWLSTLAERLWTPPASEKVAQEACEKKFQVSSFHPKLHKSYHSPWNQCEIISKCHLKSGYIIHISYRFSRSYTPRIQRRDLFAICPGLIMFIVIANL